MYIRATQSLPALSSVLTQSVYTTGGQKEGSKREANGGYATGPWTDRESDPLVIARTFPVVELDGIANVFG